MTAVLCEVEDLSRGRLKGIRKRLNLVSRETLHIEPRSLSTIFEITAIHGAPSSARRQDWTFPSIIDQVVCQYRELWTPNETTDQTYRLENIQFQLLKHRGPDRPLQEVVAFHWHPSVTGTDSHHYNNRPHLHVSMTPQPLPKAHLGVTLGVGVSDQVTVSYLDRLLDEAIGMLSVEVLELLGEQLVPSSPSFRLEPTKYHHGLRDRFGQAV